MTIGSAYVGGGFTPFGPYTVLKEAMALPASVGITLLALAIFGYVKGTSAVRHRCAALSRRY